MSRINRFTLACLTATALFLVLPTIGVAGAKDQSLKVNKTDTVTYQTAYRIGDSTLQPGVYKVEHRVADSGNHFLYFTPKSHSGQQVVEPVQCELEPAGKKISQTRTDIIADNGVQEIVRIRVQGNNAAFVF